MNKKRVIKNGDRIFARVIKNGKTIVDFVTENVSTLSELLDQLRICMQGNRGMVMVHIRNYHQGWGTERLMIV